MRSKALKSILPLLPPKGLLFVLAGAAVISAAPLFVKIVDAGPGMIACYRMIWGSLALLCIARYRSERILPGRALGAVIILAALFFSLDLLSWHQSILYVGPGLATILTNFQIFFLAAYGSLFLKEKMSFRLKLTIPLVFVGLWLVLDVRIAEITLEICFGLATGLLSALFYAAFILCLRRSRAGESSLSPTANMGLISLAAVFFTGLGGLANGEDLVIHGLENNLLMISSGVGVQALGWVLLSKGLPLLPAAQGGLLLMLQPALSFAWDVILFGRPTSAAGYLGAAITLAAIALGVWDASAPRNKGARERPGPP
ncbi:MAG: DMT family transporter [Deltaproteobacteria bacterium]|jgi:drug/metabolite transporter (DMT)-like permease|nr:DMT family transporter [Deltaproteobacteria bacterium]